MLCVLCRCRQHAHIIGQEQELGEAAFAKRQAEGERDAMASMRAPAADKAVGAWESRQCDSAAANIADLADEVRGGKA